MNPTIPTIANVILAQLGGPRFVVMTGAKHLLDAGRALAFQLPRCKDGINAVRVELEADDTYTVTFSKIARGRKYAVTTIATVSGVYDDNLREVFRSHTGLRTSL